MVSKPIAHSLWENERWSQWSERWSQNDGWTARLITDLRLWITRGHGEVNHWLTQVLSGHGIFGSYLHRIRKMGSDRCWYCEARDSVEHTIFWCDSWIGERERRASVGSRLTTESIVTAMVGSQEDWKAVDDMVKTILITKMQDERRQVR